MSLYDLLLAKKQSVTGTHGLRLKSLGNDSVILERCGARIEKRIVPVEGPSKAATEFCVLPPEARTAPHTPV
jgi:hypothetical protein